MKAELKHVVPLFFLLLFCSKSFSSTYYFSSNGSDDYTSLQAKSPATPWKSLEKLNSFFKNLHPGDSILFKRGDIFHGSIKVTASGAVFAPIHFGAYGTGNRPEITGLSQLTSWKAVGNGIYEAPCTTGGSMLLLNGTQQALGRYPNKGYLSFQAHSGNTSITDSKLNTLPQFGTGEIVIRKNRWIIDRHSITAQSGNTITYSAGNTTYSPNNNYGYFIQNNIKTLDAFGEWFMNYDTHVMSVYFGNKNPNKFSVTTTSVDVLVNIQKHQYLNFDGILFTGAGKNSFNLVQAKKVAIKNCIIDYTGSEAILASYSPFVSITNCGINHSLSGGINLDAGCTNATITNNTITNTGLIAGMGKSNSGTYEAITSFGDNANIERNRIDSVGYNGIYFGGNTSTVKNNHITYFCLTKDDGAGIYIGDWSKTVSKKVIGNMVFNGIGNSEGTPYTKSLQAEGIYIDDNSESVVITGNTVSKCANNGIKVHNAKNIDIFNNTVFDNGVQLRMEQDHYIPTSSFIRGNNVRNNIFFSKSGLQPVAKFSTHLDDINSFGSIDSNFYNCKSNVNNFKAMQVKNGKNVSANYTLSDWKIRSGKDASSVETPVNEVMFEYNAGNTAKTVTLRQPYVDVHNNVYKSEVTINPYSSIILVASNKPPAIAKNQLTALVK
ncbi:right-handed parallel beta-helix repeat-containing protein [Mucilaginibacter terrae]|uniref:Parallel beta-helix repeat protein n=1 Tax=Mucilaginibacter terrae TaxID=1955052 RepID=A0ABU3GQZ0_9SPHI|nr:right-handed parallel beta-helix repeat-containing protein [Mucilaginibacter terrae]MDT3402177.1 parallel beta-helix repeat protein [Mucilaginibacter terrae]